MYCSFLIYIVVHAYLLRLDAETQSDGRINQAQACEYLIGQMFIHSSDSAPGISLEHPDEDHEVEASSIFIVVMGNI